jgi:formylglycine-generating enzyme required for sulfatase activity
VIGTSELLRIEGGSFRMGSDDHYPEEAPAHTVSVDGFWIRSTQVTNRDFARFVDATGYVTVAERPLDPADFPGAPRENLVPGSLVFTMTKGPVDLSRINLWWTWTPGAQWRHPDGPHSDLAERQDHPVVHVAHEDAATYAEWAGEALPTEAEWEFAARAGHESRAFIWGDEPTPNGEYLANFWQGAFPWRNSGADGFERTAPVGSFPPNDYGLYDMAGNVWEWTDDWYVDKRLVDKRPVDKLPGDNAEQADKPCCIPTNPRGGEISDSYDPAMPQIKIPRKVVKGGSFLCADEYCMRYRPAARRPQMIDTGMSHIGFRTVRRHDHSED